jgi:hypothetical protein
VATGDECNRLLIVHAHACKGLTYVFRRCKRVWVAARALRIDVDETHLHCAEGFVKIRAKPSSLCCKPVLFGAPIYVFLWLREIDASARKAKRLESHRLEGAVARKDHQVSPRQFSPIFLLDGPEKTASLVKIRIIWPAVERCKPHVPAAATTTPIEGAVSTRTVPRHAHKERAICKEEMAGEDGVKL